MVSLYGLMYSVSHLLDKQSYRSGNPVIKAKISATGSALFEEFATQKGKAVGRKPTLAATAVQPPERTAGTDLQAELETILAGVLGRRVALDEPLMEARSIS